MNKIKAVLLSVVTVSLVSVTIYEILRNPMFLGKAILAIFCVVLLILFYLLFLKKLNNK